MEHKEFITEMFPNVDEDYIDHLLKNNLDVNIVVTKLLDEGHKGFRINLKELSRTSLSQKTHKKDLYYPELFNNISSINENISIDKIRKEIDFCYSKISEHKGKIEKNLSVSFYTSEIDNLSRKAKELRRQLSLVILKKSLRNTSKLDLHGLFSREALMFVSDYINLYNPPSITLITGADFNSMSLRPSVKKFLVENKYKVFDFGPYVIGKKNL